MICPQCRRTVQQNDHFCQWCGAEISASGKKVVSCLLNIGKGILIFLVTFLVYHIIFSSFFPVDEDNVLQAPDWYGYVGLSLSLFFSLVIPKKTLTPCVVGAVYTVLFVILLCFNFYICVFAAALFFPSISETTFAIFYSLCVPVLASVLEIWLLHKKLSARKGSYKPVVKPRKSAAIPSSEPVEPIIEPVLPKRYNSPVQGNIRQPSKSKYFVKEGDVETELEIIDQMDGQEFEYWCAGLLRNSGFRNVSVTKASGDHGVDILAEKGYSRYAIQCKRYTKDLGSKPVQEVVAGKAMPQYNCQFGAVITNRYFTKGATELAEANGVYLWDRDWITARLKEKKAFPGHAQCTPVPNRRESKSSTDKLYQFAHLAQWQTAANDREAFIEPHHDDVLFSQAVEVVLDTQQASVSMLQRKLNLGYARAAQIIDEMEAREIIGPFNGPMPRSILITRDQWKEMQSR